MPEFKPKLSVTDTDVLEYKSIMCLNNILSHNEIKTHFTVNDKNTNIDGKIELLTDRRFYGNITVQIKTYPSKYNGQSKFDFPTSLFGYAQRCPNELVFLLAVDYLNEIAYWKHIDKSLITKHEDKFEQETITIHFGETEVVHKNNIDEIVKRWKYLYQSKCELINRVDYISQENALLKNQLEKFKDPTFTIGPNNIIKLQIFIDELNYLLDYEYYSIKQLYYFNAWKIGIVVFEYGLNELSYITHKIEFGENGFLLKEIPIDRVKYFTNFSSMYRNCRENVINDNPKKYALKLVQEKVMELLKTKSIIFVTEETAIEYIFDFIKQNGSYIDLPDEESYDLIILKDKLENKYLKLRFGFPFIKMFGNRQLNIHHLYENVMFLINRGSVHINRLYPAKGNYGNSGFVSDWYSYHTAFLKVKFLYEVLPSLFDAYINNVFPLLHDRISFYNGYDLILVNLISENIKTEIYGPTHQIVLYYFKVCNDIAAEPQLFISLNFDSDICRSNEISDMLSMDEYFSSDKKFMHLGREYDLRKREGMESTIFFGDYCLHNMLYEYLKDRFNDYFERIN